MSRTRKGTKGPGWEPWSNRHERQQPAPDPGLVPTDEQYAIADEIDDAIACHLAGGCRRCMERDNVER